MAAADLTMASMAMLVRAKAPEFPIPTSSAAAPRMAARALVALVPSLVLPVKTALVPAATVAAPRKSSHRGPVHRDSAAPTADLSRPLVAPGTSAIR